MTDTTTTDTTTTPTVAPTWVYTQQGWHQAPQDFWATFPGGSMDDWLATMGYRKCLSEHEADTIQLTIWRAEIRPGALSLPGGPGLGWWLQRLWRHHWRDRPARAVRFLAGVWRGRGVAPTAL